jgi:hypothetical protein
MMNRETVVECVKAKNRIVVWTATDFGRYWVYRPRLDSVKAVNIRGPVPPAIKGFAEEDDLRGLAGIAALYPVFRDFPQYHCRHCDDFHNADDVAEWMLLGNVDRHIANFDFDQLHMRLTHPKRSNVSPANAA